MKLSKKAIIFTIIIAFFVVLDRFLKALCLNGALDDRFPIFGDIFGLHFAKNYYIAFSLPFSGPALTFLIGLIILILLTYWIKMLRQIANCQLPIANFHALTILIIGAILNFTDRLIFGYVIDYFDLKWFTVFNLADVFICFSVLYILKRELKNVSSKNTDHQG
jgi:signal peptidase II